MTVDIHRPREASKSLVLLRKRPDLADKAIIHGTWGEQIVEEIAPLPGESIVRKQRYSGFAGTNLDLVLKATRTKHCVFIGGATNICVNATLMDAFSLDYWPIMVRDAVFSHCPPPPRRPDAGWSQWATKMLRTSPIIACPT